MITKEKTPVRETGASKAKSETEHFVKETIPNASGVPNGEIVAGEDAKNAESTISPEVRVHVLENQEVPGLKTFKRIEEIEKADNFPFKEAFQRHYGTDAHFVQYDVLGEPYLCRINKSGAVKEELQDKEKEIVFLFLAYDYDNVNEEGKKQPWSEEDYKEWLLKLGSCGVPIARDWAARYKTTHGARVVFIVDEPIPVDEFEDRHRWLWNEFRKGDIDFDRACSDWSRLFRLPNVVRKDKETGELYETWARGNVCLEVRDRRIKASDLKSLAKDTGKASKPGRLKALLNKKQRKSASCIEEPKPEVEDAEALILTKTGGKTPFYRKFCKHLNKGDYVFNPQIFEGAPIPKAIDDSRNATVHHIVGYIVEKIFPIPGQENEYPHATKEHAYAVMLQSAQQTEGDEQTEDWSDEVWRSAQKCWALETIKQAEKQAEREAKEKELEETQEALGVPGGRGALALYQNDIYVMKHDGNYYSSPVKRGNVVAFVRDKGLDDLIPTWGENKKGDPYPLKAQDMIDRYGTVVNDVIYRPCIGGGYTETAGDKKTLVASAYERKGEEHAKFNPEVHYWLQLMLGHNFFKFCQWTKGALGFERPIAVLSIVGPRSSGKTMLVNGFNETLVGDPKAADPNDFMGRWGYGSLRSGFASINEDWIASDSVKDPASVVRDRIGGGAILVELKGLAPVTVYNPLRMILTANNMGPVRRLGKGIKNKDDEEALRARLWHVNIGHDASNYLDSKGAHDHTEGWIKGEGGQKSQYTLANHLLWIYYKSGIPDGTGRFLIEGGKGIGSQDPIGASALDDDAIEIVRYILGVLTKKERDPYLGVVTEKEKDKTIVKTYSTGLVRGLQSDESCRLPSKRVSTIVNDLLCDQSTEYKGRSNPGDGRKAHRVLDNKKLYDAGSLYGFTVPEWLEEEMRPETPAETLEPFKAMRHSESEALEFFQR